MNSKWIEDWVNNINPYFTLVGFILGVLGIVLSVVFYYKSIRKKKLSYTSLSFSLFSGKATKFEKLQFFYDKQPVKSLAASKFIIWNSGNLTIDKDDVVTKFPIQFQITPNKVIYDIELLDATGVHNNFHLAQINEFTYQLNFDYMDKNDGCVVRILHSGSLAQDVKLLGKVKGLESFTYVLAYNSDRHRKIFGSQWLGKNIAPVIYYILAAMLIAYSFTMNKPRLGIYFACLLVFIGTYHLYQTQLPEKIRNTFLFER